MKVIAFGVLLLFVLFSCQKQIDPVESGNANLVGNWTNPQYNDTLVTYTKSGELIENEPGIRFKSDNTLIGRQNSGWCGTPPIVTADYKGSWSWNDSIIDITVGYWGGTADLTWKVIKLNDQKLVISVVKAEYHQGK